MRHPLRRGIEVLQEEGALRFATKSWSYIRNLKPLYPVHRQYFYHQHGSPTNALQEEWDNLFILDACRYDMFDKNHFLPGKLEPRFSLGSWTGEWLERAINGHEYHDTVYITANPRVNRYEGHFHKVIPVWKFGWDPELKVAPPKELITVAKEVYDSYPNKKIIVHFMQPHHPFIGEFGQSKIGVLDGDTKGRINQLGGDVWNEDFTDPYVLLRRGEIDRSSVIRAYNENLNLVLSAVNELMEIVSGKTVVTSDHGELFGGSDSQSENDTYGHPTRTLIENLLKVPWLVYEDGSRRSTTVESPEKHSMRVENTEIKERLKDLGYR